MTLQDNQELRRKRALWRARRGMLELDLMLVPFVEREYQRLSETEIKELEQLLSLDDVELLALLSGTETESDAFARLVDRIRKSNETASES